MVKKRPTTKGKGGKKLATLDAVKKIINRNVELKKDDTEIDYNPSDGQNVYLDLTTMIQGDDDDSQRVGNEVMIKSIDFRYQVINADNFNIVRFIVFRWKEDTLTAYPSYVLDTGPYPNGPVKVNAPYFWDDWRKGKLKILSDRTISIGNAGPGVVRGHYKKYFKNGLKLRFSEGEGTGVALTGMNKIFFMAISDSNIAAHPRISGVSRITYTDA